MPQKTHAKTEKEKHANHDVEHSPSESVQLGGLSSYADMLTLQQVAGNQAVDQLLKPEISNVPHVVTDVLSSGSGQPLDPATRGYMESRFDHDFSDVHVHTDEQAAE